jgi:hypothetical protein
LFIKNTEIWEAKDLVIKILMPTQLDSHPMTILRSKAPPQMSAALGEKWFACGLADLSFL